MATAGGTSQNYSIISFRCWKWIRWAFGLGFKWNRIIWVQLDRSCSMLMHKHVKYSFVPPMSDIVFSGAMKEPIRYTHTHTHFSSQFLLFVVTALLFSFHAQQTEIHFTNAHKFTFVYESSCAHLAHSNNTRTSWEYVATATQCTHRTNSSGEWWRPVEKKKTF